MLSLIVKITYLFAYTTINADCNWVQESSATVKSATNVCRTIVSNGIASYKRFVCNGNSVMEEVYNDEGCTQLSTSNTITPYASECSVTDGTCEYAMMSSGCLTDPSYTYYPIPTNVCVNDGSNYYIITCSSSGTGVTRRTSSGITKSTDIYDCN